MMFYAFAGDAGGGQDRSRKSRPRVLSYPRTAISYSREQSHMNMKNAIEDITYNPPQWAKFLIEMSGVIVVVAICALTITSHTQQRGIGAGGNALAPQPLDLCSLESDGFLSGRLYGAVDVNIDWRGADMNCEGMLRPDGKGIRLLFASTQGREDRLLFVIGVDGKIDQLTGQERVANITIIDEIDGRFFSTSGNDRCWTTIHKVESIFGETFPAFQIDGDLYCAGGLPSLSDRGSVTLDDFQFSGRLALDDP